MIYDMSWRFYYQIFNKFCVLDTYFNVYSKMYNDLTKSGSYSKLSQSNFA